MIDSRRETSTHTKGRFTHETESPWPLHFKHCHYWKGWSRSGFASHYAWGTNGVCECTVDVKSTWIPTWHRMDHVLYHLDYFQKPLLGGRLDTKSEDHGTLNVHNRWFFFLFYHVWGHAWIEIHWNNVWLRAGHIWLHTTLEGLWPHMILEVSWDGLWTLFFGLSQFHGHGVGPNPPSLSVLVRVMVLRITCIL